MEAKRKTIGQECHFDNIKPVSDTPIIPGIVPAVFDMPVMMPAYLGAISNELTPHELAENPTKATLQTIPIIARSVL